MKPTSLAVGPNIFNKMLQDAVRTFKTSAVTRARNVEQPTVESLIANDDLGAIRTKTRNQSSSDCQLRYPKSLSRSEVVLAEVNHEPAAFPGNVRLAPRRLLWRRRMIEIMKRKSSS